MRSKSHPAKMRDGFFNNNFMHFVYIIYSKDFDKYYVGETEDVERRLFYHNHGEKSTFTKRYRPWVLVKHWQFEDKTKARKAEIFIKKQKSRKFIERLINDEADLVEIFHP